MNAVLNIIPDRIASVCLHHGKPLGCCQFTPGIYIRSRIQHVVHMLISGIVVIRWCWLKYMGSSWHRTVSYTHLCLMEKRSPFWDFISAMAFSISSIWAVKIRSCRSADTGKDWRRDWRNFGQPTEKDVYKRQHPDDARPPACPARSCLHPSSVSNLTIPVPVRYALWQTNCVVQCPSCHC